MLDICGAPPSPRCTQMHQVMEASSSFARPSGPPEWLRLLVPGLHSIFSTVCCMHVYALRPPPPSRWDLDLRSHHHHSAVAQFSSAQTIPPAHYGWSTPPPPPPTLPAASQLPALAHGADAPTALAAAQSLTSTMERQQPPAPKGRRILSSDLYPVLPLLLVDAPPPKTRYPPQPVRRSPTVWSGLF